MVRVCGLVKRGCKSISIIKVFFDRRKGEREKEREREREREKEKERKRWGPPPIPHTIYLPEDIRPQNS